MNVNFKVFLKQKYDEWARKNEGGYKGFAAYLGIPPTSLSNWMNSGHTPGKASIAQLAKVLGNEVYEVLGLSISVPLDSIPDDMREDLLSTVRELKERSERQYIADPNSPEARALAIELFGRFLENQVSKKSSKR